MVDFLVDHPPKIDELAAKEYFEIFTQHYTVMQQRFDGLNTKISSGAGIVISSPSGQKMEYAFHKAKTTEITGDS